MIRLATAALTLVVALDAHAADPRAERSLAIYPAQETAVRMDHGKHLGEGGMSCDSCHDVAKSRKASDLNLPKQAVCEDCHDIAAAAKGEKTDPPSSCKTCHPGFDPTVMKAPPRWRFPTANLVFPHQTHVEKKVECKVCHGDMASVVEGTRQHLPKMETCLKCHDGDQAPNKCATCHLVQPSGKLQAQFASTRGVLEPGLGNPFGVAHDARFAKEHGNRASLDAALCAECHTEADCLRCHDGRTKPLDIHPNDFLALHPVAARTDTPRCDACHRKQSFCVSCHEQSGVGRDGDPAFRAKNLKVHPDASIWIVQKGPNHHGVAASRDINACIACHREETCLTCHSERKTAALPDNGGAGARNGFGFRSVNPHPPGFSDACRAMMQRNDRACLKCHTGDSLGRLCPAP